MDFYDIAKLLKRSAQGEILAKEEEHLLDVWRAKNVRNEQLFLRLKNPHELTAALLEMERIDPSLHFANFKNRIQKRQQRKRLYYIGTAAASILLVFSFALYFMLDRSVPYTEQLVSEFGGDALPASNKATLTLSTGEVLELRADQAGLISGEAGVTYGDGTLLTDTVVEYATISTPKGGQYQVTLSDGTKVWLNAASSLRYPVRFVGSERKVEFEGEGYFEVSHDASKPFYVKTEGQEVEVLGTQFNINSYKDEVNIQTTLVEGSIRVLSISNQRAVKLLPSQKSELGKEGLKVSQADVKAIIAWKENDFMFKGQDLSRTMRQLARWYDVDVVYAADAPLDLKIGGSVSRNNRLSSVLRAMASTNSVAFDFDGNTILVKRAQ